ncbi:MAG: hypothetical protein M3O30_02870 [Planctomycetota bacterium]|nr:hypothetical protein [Planctomycetota bacterium]
MESLRLLLAAIATVALVGCMTPNGVPEHATLVWYGQGNDPNALKNIMPDVQPGQVYIYDETEKHLALVRSVWQEHRDLQFAPNPDHRYKIYFLPTPE